MTSRDGHKTAAAVAARRHSALAALDRVHAAIARMRREKVPISVTSVSRRAEVSRTFLYSNSQARAAVAEAQIDTRTRLAQERDDQDAAQEATWRERALNAEDALKAAHAEIVQQRSRIGELMGQVRDLEAEWTQEAIQRITTENTTHQTASTATHHRQPDLGGAVEGRTGEPSVPGPSPCRPRSTVRRPRHGDLRHDPRLASGCPTC
ncbi:DUF6262 family protein [Nonomuraea sp. WAC 01424]|uniref:DUF6262 family protein n=1 Tax=Nonomuraea sp. WAC 01424 TaxID=2203200 RepID=UPI001C8BE6C1|nr:DUF6262 family protein [Nonomuraea sp. WAC 01424]